MVVESEIRLRSSDHGDLSGHKSLTAGNCPSLIYLINRTNPHGHWIWAFLSMTMGKCPVFFKYHAMTAPCLPDTCAKNLLWIKRATCGGMSNQSWTIHPPPNENGNHIFQIQLNSLVLKTWLVVGLNDLGIQKWWNVFYLPHLRPFLACVWREPIPSW
jgi:hypothetical protein